MTRKHGTKRNDANKTEVSATGGEQTLSRDATKPAQPFAATLMMSVHNSQTMRKVNSQRGARPMERMEVVTASPETMIKDRARRS